MSRKRNPKTQAALNALTWGIVLVSMLPIFVMLLASLGNYNDAAQGNLFTALSDPQWQNYREMWQEVDFFTYLVNSLIICGSTTVLATLLACFAGYGLARFNFGGKNAFAVALTSTQVIPSMLFFLPLYMLYKQLTDWGVPMMNTRHGMILLYTAMFTPASIWIVRGFFVSIPRELEDAAVIDGCSRFGAFVRVVLPISLPGIIATASFIFLLAWDEVFFAWVLTSTPDVQTVPVGLRMFVSQHATRYDLLMAAATVSVIPVLLTFFASQRYFIKGLAAGAVKG